MTTNLSKFHQLTALNLKLKLEQSFVQTNSLKLSIERIENEHFKVEIIIIIIVVVVVVVVVVLVF
jgi:hypothetical protein